jgi:hypothetical protein
MALLGLWTLAGLGCYRATGFERNPMVAEVVPETGGDRVLGVKAKAGQGDYFIGNDFIELGIDSTVYGDSLRTPMAGAASGGGIVDAGYIVLDTSYNRVNVPSSAMYRLAPVLNQDPQIQVVFDQFATGNNGGQASITMTGRVLDPNNRLDQGTTVLSGVSVSHTLTIAQLDRFFTLTTVVTNNTGATLPISSVGDCLVQQGGGYAFNVPANFDYQGNALATRWGVQIPSYTDFAYAASTPLQTSVQAAEVGLMALEPGADAVDSHCSLGFLPLDADRLLVASDPQDLLTLPNRPTFPARLVVGSLPVGSLAPGQSLSFHRRLYILGGTSVATGIVGGLPISANYPDEANGLFNLMDVARYTDTTIRPVQDTGLLTFTLSGNAQRQGPMPTEIRIERNVGAVTPPATGPGATWQVQRVEWLEPNENLSTTTGLAPSILQVKLPVGLYRMVLTSKGVNGQTLVQTRTLFHNLNEVNNVANQNQVGLAQPIWIQKDQEFKVDPNDILCPGAASDPNQSGPITANAYSAQFFQTRELNGPNGNLQPLRLTFLNADGTPAAPMRRQRTLASRWDAVTDLPTPASGHIAGQYQFRGGNEMFGCGFTRLLPTEFAWFPNGGTYQVFGTRGALSQLTGLDTGSTFAAYDGQTDVNHTLTVTPRGLPPGWTSFDLPGPGQATTGGYLPGEKLASAMANGIQVVGHTEQDLLVDPNLLYDDFRHEFETTDLSAYQIPASLSAINRPADFPRGYDPFVVGGRTSTLAGYGTVTALFTPAATAAPLGGAASSASWDLADFITQSLGQYTVVHRPRGPQGLFTLLGPPNYASTDPTQWWNQTGPLAFGKLNGGFDAIELLRGESLGSAGLATWFNEFLAVRSDWFAMLNDQYPTRFTKALGLSSAAFSLDTPVGLASTYLKAQPTTQTDLSGVLAALQSGAAVATTGPFLDVSVGSQGPGGLVPGPASSVNLAINLWRSDWMPVDEIRVIVNGVQTPVLFNGVTVNAINPAALAASGADPRLFTGVCQVSMPTDGKDAWIVVEAGVPLTINTAVPYVPTAASVPARPNGTPWSAIMRGIYPIAVTNPIFVNVTGGSYKPHGL